MSTNKKTPMILTVTLVQHLYVMCSRCLDRTGRYMKSQLQGAREVSAMDYDRQVGLLGHRFNVLFGLIYDSFVCHTMSRELDNAAYKRRITVLSTWGIIAARAIAYQAKRDFNVARKLDM